MNFSYSSITKRRRIFSTPSGPGRVFIFILLTVWRFCTSTETHVGIKILKTLTINLVTSMEPF
ncbi:hypothetical protein E2C01_001125 [Portunus trituberculatus]|uniref:Uncharacterized protein n=1 Tax=Portunus trituberculatus TaxID=210409 RepID=A0A5B7CGE5_PORTR|nr:hypothetical protein [Portunus trituberculatus]